MKLVIVDIGGVRVQRKAVKIKDGKALVSILGTFSWYPVVKVLEDNKIGEEDEFKAHMD